MKALALTLLAAATLAACDPNMIRPDVNRVDPKTGEVTTYTSTKEIETGILKAFPDIPVPAGHSIDLERSTIFTSNNQSLGKIVAEGRADVISLYRFYETAMPQNGWTLVNAFQSSTSSMYYAKPGRFVAIIMENTGRLGSRVTLNIGPE
ncbi:MAG: hypothetical protein H6922_04790 [Pseudomonadaceae bacterium]|nr:hypothetical protein [Pseudomonadaceae bacterium]